MKPETTVPILVAALVLHIPLVVALGFAVLALMTPERAHRKRARAR